MVLVGFDRTGPDDEPQRPVNQYWAKDGRLLAEFDHVFHAPDVPTYEVLRLRGQVAQLMNRLREYEQVAAPAPSPQAPAAINSEARLQAQEVM